MNYFHTKMDASLPQILSSALAIFLIANALPAKAQDVPSQLSPGSPASRKSTSDAPKIIEEWLGVYLGNKKAGYSSSISSPTTYEGKPVTREIGRGVTKLQLLGTSVEEEELTETISDLQFRPLYQKFDVKSNGSALHVEAKFDYLTRKISCTIGEGADATQKEIEIPKGADLATDSNALTRGKPIAIGQKLSFFYLDPLSVELKEAHVEVTGKAAIKDDNGKFVSVFLTKSDLASGKMTSWSDAKGALYRGELSMGPISMVMTRESKAHALDIAYIAPSLALPKKGSEDTPVPPADFAVATAITPDKTIENPRKLHSLKVSIAGISNKKLILSDERQIASNILPGKKSGFSATYTLHDEVFDPANSLSLPIQQPGMELFLGKAAYLDTENVEIKKTALEIRGDETNVYKVCVAIRNWVNREMTPDPSIGVIRSATDVYGRRRGVCRDYATLFTALARAAGVPTRLCAGIVYSQGKFYYHAWAECYIKKWVAFDPTLYLPSFETEYVDATHIKFAQGDVTGMLNVVSIVGQLQIKVKEQTL